jgi:hypothetical protein
MEVFKTIERTIIRDEHPNLYNIFDENNIFIGSILDTTFNDLLDCNLIKEIKGETNE